jgi:hypothetical protein
VPILVKKTPFHTNQDLIDKVFEMVTDSRTGQKRMGPQGAITDRRTLDGVKRGLKGNL